MDIKKNLQNEGFFKEGFSIFGFTLRIYVVFIKKLAFPAITSTRTIANTETAIFFIHHHC